MAIASCLEHCLNKAKHSGIWYDRKPGRHALHLRWLDDSLFEAIQKAARYRNMTTVKFVTDILRNYLAGGLHREIGVCELCRLRAALAPLPKKGKAKTIEDEREVKTEAENEPTHSLFHSAL